MGAKNRRRGKHVGQSSARGEKRRVKRWGVSFATMKVFLETGNVIRAAKVAADGIPMDARLIDVGIDGPVGFRTIWLVIESDTFPEVKEGEVIPVLYTVFEQLAQPGVGG